MSRRPRQERGTQHHGKATRTSPTQARQRDHYRTRCSPVPRPVVEDPIRGPKVKQTVSAAGIFKKRKTGTNAKEHQRKQSPSPPPPTLKETLEASLSSSHKDGLEAARQAIDANLTLNFINIHEGFLQKLSERRSNDDAFLAKITSAANALSAPLSEEQIETTFTRDGRCVTEIFQIGQRLALFKSSVEKDKKKLETLWAQWEELQNDFIELGVEVIGSEAFAGGKEEEEGDGNVVRVGYKKDMELMNFEHGARVEELAEEVEELRGETLQKAEEAEKELHAIAMEHQVKLLQAFMAE